jgi:hypothetical protein
MYDHGCVIVVSRPSMILFLVCCLLSSVGFLALSIFTHHSLLPFFSHQASIQDLDNTYRSCPCLVFVFVVSLVLSRLCLSGSYPGYLLFRSLILTPTLTLTLTLTLALTLTLTLLLRSMKNNDNVLPARSDSPDYGGMNQS